MAERELLTPGPLLSRNVGDWKEEGESLQHQFRVEKPWKHPQIRIPSSLGQKSRVGVVATGHITGPIRWTFRHTYSLRISLCIRSQTLASDQPQASLSLWFSSQTLPLQLWGQSFASQPTRVGAPFALRWGSSLHYSSVSQLLSALPSPLVSADRPGSAPSTLPTVRGSVPRLPGSPWILSGTYLSCASTSPSSWRPLTFLGSVWRRLPPSRACEPCKSSSSLSLFLLNS